jgi:hypothetical protein
LIRALLVSALLVAAGATIVALPSHTVDAKAKAKPTPAKDCHNYEGDIIPCKWLDHPPCGDECRRADCHVRGCVWRYFENYCLTSIPEQCGECVCGDGGAR